MKFEYFSEKSSTFAVIMENNDVLSVMNSFQITGRSPLLLQAIQDAVKAAPYDVNVLICGENGVGKEVFHKILHNYSPRRFKKCIAVNCGGLPEGTIDSELFGHVKGAFTGALSDRKGYFEEADGGTIFLDEIGELPLPTQARLLRILESGEYLRVGSSEVKKTNVRVVAATNVDLQKAIREGKFRIDLYYRLTAVVINVPPLRKRPEDIHLLFRKFSNDVATKYNMPAIQLDDMARRKLVSYNWPGNVRQLLHVVEQMSIVENTRLISTEILDKYLPAFNTGVTLHDETNTTDTTFAPGEKQMLYKLIFDMKNQLEDVKNRLGIHTTSSDSQTVHALPSASSVPVANPSVYKPMASSPNVQDDIIEAEVEDLTNDYKPAVVTPISRQESEPAPKTLDDIERIAIKKALEHNGGNKRKAADELGISERTIHRKIQEFNL